MSADDPGSGDSMLRTIARTDPVLAMMADQGWREFTQQLGPLALSVTSTRAAFLAGFANGALVMASNDRETGT